MQDVDEYLRGVEEPKRGTLEALRRTILEIVPEAEQVISYRVPAFRVRGRIVAGFAAFRNHLSYLPFSGSVLGQLADELDGYTMTKSSLHFPVDQALPKSLVEAHRNTSGRGRAALALGVPERPPPARQRNVPTSGRIRRPRLAAIRTAAPPGRSVARRGAPGRSRLRGRREPPRG
jgi:uncharacterized protein YdhG (YjbR/CyaY superfamily)